MCDKCNDTGWRQILVTDPVLDTDEGPTYWTERPCPCQQEPEAPEIDVYEKPPDWLLYSQTAQRDLEREIYRQIEQEEE